MGEIQTLIRRERGDPHAAESANGPARASTPFSERCLRIFSIGCDPVMKATIFILSPQRGQASVTSKTSESSSDSSLKRLTSLAVRGYCLLDACLKAESAELSR